MCLASCQQRDTKTTAAPNDSAHAVISKDTAPAKNDKPATIQTKDSSLLQLAEKVLVTLKEKNFKQLATYAHPDSGIFFSAYAYVDKTDKTRLSVAELNNPATASRKVKWGAFDPQDSSALITITTYFDKYVYDEDFLEAPKKSVNQFHNRGTTINNIQEAFPNTEIVEFHFPGFDPKYEGLDYRTLRLVFKPENNKYLLTGIVHDQWTP